MIVSDIFKERSTYSAFRMTELKTRLASLSELSGFPSLTVFGALMYFFCAPGIREILLSPVHTSFGCLGGSLRLLRK
jgi:hypothetical protein